MRKLVILYPAHYEQVTGGAELQISYLAHYAKLKGYEVHFIFEDKEMPISNVDNVVLHPLKKINSPGLFGRRWSLYRGKIISLLDEIVPDTIYTRIGLSWVGIAAIYAKKHGIKHIHAMASDIGALHKFNIRMFLKPLDIIELILINKGLKNAGEIIVQNEVQRDTLFSRFGRKGIQVNQMSPSVNEDDIRKDTDMIYVLWIGNFKHVKRPELFIEMAGRLGELKSDYRLIMVGRIQDKYKGIIQNAINKYSRLEYRGELSQEAVNDLLCKSHLLVNTSENEGFSNTFIQAWMRKVPVVSMNSNPDGLIIKYSLGYITPDIGKLTDAVKRLVEDHYLRERMGQEAFFYADKNHSLEKNINKVLSLI